jgi:uncharacterized repeat protein (TIGR02543 family)
MKIKMGLKMALVAVLGAGFVLSGCKAADQSERSGDAELSSFTIGGKNVSPPAAITGDAWNKTSNLNNLDSKHTVTITFAAADSLTVAIQAKAGDNTVVQYAVTTDVSSKPGDFKSINGSVALSSGSYLYIKVTAENGTINYYRFKIEQEAPPANKVVITFNLAGGSLASSTTIAAVTIDKGATLGAQFPGTPTKTNFTFGGWFNETTEYKSTTQINANVTLTAKWTLITPGKPVTGFTLGKTSTTLTLYSSEQLTWTITPVDASYQTITWTSSAPTVASVDSNGKITAADVTSNLSEKYTVTPATGSAVITGTTLEGKTASITVNTTVKPETATVESVPAMKDQFKDYFMMGNIAGNANDINGTGITATRLKRHYNILTAENAMKPSYFSNNRDASTGAINYTWTTPDNFVNACQSNNFMVHGHVLLWHSQNPNWVWDQIASKTGTIVSGMTKEKALEIMKGYITDVMARYKGKIYSWDVLNEVFPDNASSSANWKDAMRKGASGEGQDANPWYIAIGSDFVYEGFLAARLADPTAILYYNDYNTDNTNRARLIRDMVKEVNDKYLALPANSKPAGDPAGRLLIEGIGMQELHNTNVTAAQIRATINTFRPLGVKLSVSELDVLCQGYSEYSNNPAKNDNKNDAIFPETPNNSVTNNGFIKAAQLYGEYMKLYLENKDIIERVALWGVIDKQSWRDRGLPLIFDKDGKAKPAYYKMIGALEL